MRTSSVIVLFLLMVGSFTFVLYGIRRHYLREIAQINEASRDQRIILNELISVQVRNWQTKGSLPARQKLKAWKGQQTTTIQELLQGRKVQGIW